MLDGLYDLVNDYRFVKIALASSNDIRSWSLGEVKKPETINYRTYRPERDGLFCESIFGPEKDYECTCGKYKGTKYKGLVCDRCDVKITHSRVRRKRMGHIDLAAPVVHIWMSKGRSPLLSCLLNIPAAEIERIVYYQSFIVTNPGQTELDHKQRLTEDEYLRAVRLYGASGFAAMTGAEAIRELFQQLDLETLAKEIRVVLGNTKSKQRQKDLSKRLKIVEQIKGSQNEPKWMVLDVIPVIPPDLRPLVLLESGNFSTCDLNDLYRRIINRNSRVKKLVELKAPEVILRNEKRMLQQAVDALFDNGRCRRPVLGSSKRPLKSITDMIKGKQGRFRENLLGKRVDYSARSVIVVGPELKIWQCGLPKKIALELFQPFIIRKLKEHGLADTIKSAKRMIERRDPEVWDILEQVIQNHPVMLNRAPTLHRMGIQAFEPVLVEGNAIKIHPLVCTGYNADFDGDQMAVHLPLSVEAQAETHVLMMSTHNIFSPANGNPIVSPSLDIVMGVYFLTCAPSDSRRRVRRFKDTAEALHCFQLPHSDPCKISFHDLIEVRLDRFDEVVGDQDARAQQVPSNHRVITTLGRLIFSEILPDGMPFYNCALGKKGTARVIDDTFARKGRSTTIDLLDAMKELGFRYSTLSGLSFAITDLRIPAEKKALLDATQKKVDRVEKAYQAGAITERERHNQLLDLWRQCQADVMSKLVDTLRNDRRDSNGAEVSVEKSQDRSYLNPVHVFADSGARGSMSQIQQLAGMCGLLATPGGEVLDIPIRANFREGLSMLEYFSSARCTRPLLSMKQTVTPQAGYLLRKLCDAMQATVVVEDDCGALSGIPKKAIYRGEYVDVPLKEVIRGRTSVETIINPITDEVIVARNEVISDAIAANLENLGLTSVYVRSPFTCESARGVCSKCYGVDGSTGRPVEIGMAVGVIAAQSIGEPIYQISMRGHHQVESRRNATSRVLERAAADGTIRLQGCGETVMRNGELLALEVDGECALIDAFGVTIQRCPIPLGSRLFVRSGDTVRQGDRVAECDTSRKTVRATNSGTIRFNDLIEDETVRRVERSDKTRTADLVTIQHYGPLRPRLDILDARGRQLEACALISGTTVLVRDGQQVTRGEVIAVLPGSRETAAGFERAVSRLTSIFEAREPGRPAATAEISGRVEVLRTRWRGKAVVRVTDASGVEHDHRVELGRTLFVQSGDHVAAGDKLSAGERSMSDLLRAKGEDAVFEYLLARIQKLFRDWSLEVRDAHLEVVLKRMLSKVRITNPGDSRFLLNDVVDRSEFHRVNDALVGKRVVQASGGTHLSVGLVVDEEAIRIANSRMSTGSHCRTRRPIHAEAKIILMGVSKLALQSESFLSRASFQETAKVLAEAALAGAVDELRGLKENVLLGHLIPAGTGFEAYSKAKVRKLVDVPDYVDDAAAARYDEASREAEALGAARLGGAVTTVKDRLAQAIADGQAGCVDGGE